MDGSETTLAQLLSIAVVCIKIQLIYGEEVYFKVISNRDDFELLGLNLQSVK